MGVWEGVRLPGERNEKLDLDQWEKVPRFVEMDKLNSFSMKRDHDDLLIESETTRPEGPAVMSYGVITTRGRHLNPGLKGINIFEVDFRDYTNNDVYLNKYMTGIGHKSDVEDPFFGLYLMGWGLTIGNVRGFVGGKDDADRKRAVQFHFDHYSRWGFGSCMNRQISAEDIAQLPRFTQEELLKHLEDIYRGKVTPYRSMDDATVLSGRHYHIDGRSVSNFAGIRGSSSGHRYGIMLSDGGNTFSWMLDGTVMDSYDITGYFGSSTDDFAEGAYISIGGGAGFQKNLWRFANPKIRVSKD